MNKTAIKNFAIWARNKLIADITYKAGLMGISEKGINPALPQSTKDTEFYDIGTKEPYSISGDAVCQRRRLTELISQKAESSDNKTAYHSVIEEVAYTWFNRLIAVRFMEVNDYLPSHIRVLSSDSAAKLEPDLVTTPLEAELELTEAEKEKIIRLKNENQVDDLFRLLFIKQCNALKGLLPNLFEKTADYSELLLNVSVTDQDGVVYHLVHDINEDDFNIEKGGQVEIIGWLYQYYNTEDFNTIYDGKLSQGQLTKYLVPAATQLFTPDWVVRYMVENSLGRLWLEGHQNDGLKSGWKYYLDETEQEADVQAQLNKIREEYKTIKPEDIKVMDPCMGSGHILVYAFDVLMQIYEAAGYPQREAAKSILEHNIYGLDIDDRAFQLAYFAVIMKARQYNRRIMNYETDCHVYSIQESNTVNRNQLKYLGAGMSELERNDAINEITNLLDTFTNAKEYGSILNVGPYDWDLLRRFVSHSNDQGQMSLDSLGLDATEEQLQTIIDIGEVMAQKYDIVCTNPPYLGSGKFSPKLSNYIERYYEDAKYDLGMVMLDKILFSFLKKNGFSGAITTVSWMFIKSFEKFRVKVLSSKSFVCLADYGTELFEGKIGHLPVASWVNRNSCVNQRMNAVRLVDFCYSQRDKKQIEFFNKNNHFSIRQSEFHKIPGSPIAYWVSKNMLEVFGKNSIYDTAQVQEGLKTGDNDRFIRKWFEVSFLTTNMSGNKEPKWIFHTKGGDFRKWYGNQEDVLNFSNNGRELRAFKGSSLTGYQNYFLECITYSRITSAKTSFRFTDKGSIPNMAGLSIYPKNNNLYILGWLNTNIIFELLSITNPTINFPPGTIGRLPIWLDFCGKDKVSNIVKQNISISKSDWDSFETSWDFETHPLIAFRHNEEINQDNLLYADDIQNDAVIVDYGKQLAPIALAYDAWERFADRQFEQLKANEEELNRIFIDIYGLQDELTPEVEDKDVTVRKADLQRDIKSLLSYAVGCMFGRYSLDVPGLVYAGGEWDDSKYSSFIPDKDNILPITDEEYFEDDIVGLFCAWLKKVYGEETLEENLDFIAKALSNKGNTSREVIRNYFLNDFFKDHCKIYKKRPIYWLFDSGKQNGFKALIYMHRYDENTIGNLRIDYLHRMERIYESEIARMQDTIDSSQNAREVTAATKRKEKLQKQVKECKEYDEKIAHLALSRIAIDLDDGVKVNYEKVQTVDGKKYDVLAKI